MEAITGYWMDFLVALGGLALEMSPWLVLGFVFAGLFKVWFPEEWSERYLSKPTFSSVICAAMLGVPLPLCSCGVLPMAVSMHKKGASKGATSSFLISTPQTGVDNILATYSLLGLPFAIAKPIIAFVSGVMGGVIMNLLDKNVVEKSSSSNITCADESVGRKKNVYQAIRYGFTDLFREMYKWLIIGLVLAALLNLFLPDDLSLLFEQYPGIDMLLALLISVPMYICATGSIPVALVLLLKGFSPGAAIVLLMAGPATNIAGIVLLAKSISVRFSAIYVGSIVFASLLFGWIANLIFSSGDFITSLQHHAGHLHNHNVEYNLFQWASVVLLSGLILWFLSENLWLRLAPLWRKKANSGVVFRRFKLERVTCRNCSGKIEKRLLQEKRVYGVELLFEKREIIVETTLSGLQISSIVEALNYGCKEIVGAGDQEQSNQKLFDSKLLLKNENFRNQQSDNRNLIYPKIVKPFNNKKQ